MSQDKLRMRTVFGTFMCDCGSIDNDGDAKGNVDVGGNSGVGNNYNTGPKGKMSDNGGVGAVRGTLSVIAA